jgi:hypothetical protein
MSKPETHLTIKYETPDEADTRKIRKIKYRQYNLHIYVTIYLYFILPIHHFGVIHREIPPASAASCRQLRHNLFQCTQALSYF